MTIPNILPSSNNLPFGFTSQNEQDYANVRKAAEEVYKEYKGENSSICNTLATY